MSETLTSDAELGRGCYGHVNQPSRSTQALCDCPACTLKRQLLAARDDLKAWEAWRVAAKEELDRISFIAHNHNMPYRGPAMPEPTACLPEKGPGRE